MSDFLITLREGTIQDIDFTNDEFEAAVEAVIAGNDYLSVAARELKAKGEELGVDMEPMAQAVITFGNFTKKQYKGLNPDEKQQLKDAFAGLVPAGSAGEAQIENLFNLYVDSRAAISALVELGDTLLATDPA